MAQLAIKGHATRGKEVIEILEMLGGVNYYGILPSNVDLLYIIRSNDNFIIGSYPFCTFEVFTLDEFLEKFPYKVGDKVYYDNKVCDVIEMLWNSNLNTISYGVYDGKIKNLAIVEELKPYKEETMGTITIDDFKANTKEWLIDKLESMSKDNALQAICNIHDELHKPKYPKTYEECCGVLGIDVSRTIGHSEDLPFYNDVTCYENNLLSSLAVLRKLLICRDAYWKLAGEQMGLGKPWKPDWHDNEKKYTIEYYGGGIVKDFSSLENRILAFPTEEMRDAFYENFKEEIEKCKELL